MDTSARRHISHPSLDRSDRPDIPLHIKYLVDALELDVSGGQGTTVARPIDPGYAKYVYWSTDDLKLSYWDGTSWHDVGVTDYINKSLIDAKGDLIVGLSDNVPSRVPIGTTGHTLYADSAQPAGVRWGLDKVLDLIAAKGDILAGTGPDALTNVPVGANGTTLIADSAQGAGVRFGAPTLSYQQAHLGADVPLTLATTWYDGPTLTLAPGIYKLDAILTVTRAGGATDDMYGKIWDGTDPIVSVGNGANNDDDMVALPMTAIYTALTTVTVRAAALASSTGALIKAALVANGVGNNASTLTAIRIG